MRSLLCLCLCLAAIAVALHQTWRAHQLATALTEARLTALAMQLRPHFLLNALNTAAELVYDDAATADRLLTALGRLLSHALRHDGRRHVSLQEELALLGHYVEIERARFGDRLTIEWCIDPQTLGARVPPLLMQPLVENAVRHGIAPREARGMVRIAASREGPAGDTLRLIVSDDGVGFEPGRGVAGVGLANVRARLQTLYGQRQSVDIASHRDTGTVITLRLPRCMALA